MQLARVRYPTANQLNAVNVGSVNYQNAALGGANKVILLYPGQSCFEVLNKLHVEAIPYVRSCEVCRKMADGLNEVRSALLKVADHLSSMQREIPQSKLCNVTLMICILCVFCIFSTVFSSHSYFNDWEWDCFSLVNCWHLSLIQDSNYHVHV